MSTTKKKRTRFVIGIMLLFALCLFFMFHMVGKTDSNGNITETYVIEAEISLNTKNTMKLYFERLEDATYTYILKFADKDIIISNGKVVE